MHVDHVWRNARLLTMAGPDGGRIEDGCVAAQDGRIAWAGPQAAAPRFSAAAETDCRGHWITPGLIDCHTHLVYAGNRVAEHAMRLEGATYEQVAAAGGGIVSTVAAVRAADEADLIAQSAPRLRALKAEGVTTVEIKSGYGLTAADEAKMLRAARALGAAEGVRVATTFLGAHAVPPEAEGDADAYIADVIETQLPAVHAEGLADAVDAFCETIAFTADQTRRVFEAAAALGLPVKLHAEQLSNQRGAELVAGFGGLSADHLEWLDDDGVDAMAEAGTVAVLLPGAFYFLRETRLPPIQALRDRGVPMAVATDCNPGSSPVSSILLAMNMAATCFRMTPMEILAGVTSNAARALGLADAVGTLEAGKACDLAVWSVDDPAELVFALGVNPLQARVTAGIEDVDP
jgi:imidazolonepropionase